MRETPVPEALCTNCAWQRQVANAKLLILNNKDRVIAKPGRGFILRTLLSFTGSLPVPGFPDATPGGPKATTKSDR
jgi:hypothetical protein